LREKFVEKGKIGSTTEERSRGRDFLTLELREKFGERR